MSFCTVCGHLICDHTANERDQTQEEVDRPLTDAEFAIVTAGNELRIEMAKRWAHLGTHPRLSIRTQEAGSTSVIVDEFRSEPQTIELHGTADRAIITNLANGITQISLVNSRSGKEIANVRLCVNGLSAFDAS